MTAFRRRSSDPLAMYEERRAKLREYHRSALDMHRKERQLVIAEEDIDRFSDAVSELVGGILQIIGNLDEIAKTDPQRANNLAESIIFAIRDQSAILSICTVSFTGAKLFDNEKAAYARRLRLPKKGRQLKVRDRVLPDLVAVGASMSAITTALNDALKAARLDVISARQAARWKKAFLAEQGAR